MVAPARDEPTGSWLVWLATLSWVVAGPPMAMLAGAGLAKLLLALPDPVSIWPCVPGATGLVSLLGAVAWFLVDTPDVAPDRTPDDAGALLGQPWVTMNGRRLWLDPLAAARRRAHPVAPPAVLDMGRAQIDTDHRDPHGVARRVLTLVGAQLLGWAPFVALQAVVVGAEGLRWLAQCSLPSLALVAALAIAYRAAWRRWRSREVVLTPTQLRTAEGTFDLAAGPYDAVLRFGVLGTTLALRRTGDALDVRGPFPAVAGLLRALDPGAVRGTPNDVPQELLRPVTRARRRGVLESRR